jgi:hypothetical protein
MFNLLVTDETLSLTVLKSDVTCCNVTLAVLAGLWGPYERPTRGEVTDKSAPCAVQASEGQPS